uniref:Ribosomal protein L16 n=1 Tax=Sinomenium acutum TaxID=152363 RepID=A0A6G9DWX8_9MAGN|nr:ribosomal protein L16 [Sinomenium acutum]QIP53885.1 ribosomal protein L16 [Sinomenium acutum]
MLSTPKEPDSVNNIEEELKEYLIEAIVFVSVGTLFRHLNPLGSHLDKYKPGDEQLHDMRVVVENYGYEYFQTNLLPYDLQKHVWARGKDLPNIGYLSLNRVEYFMKLVEYQKLYPEKLFQYLRPKCLYALNSLLRGRNVEPKERGVMKTSNQPRVYLFLNKQYFFFFFALCFALKKKD